MHGDEEISGVEIITSFEGLQSMQQIQDVAALLEARQGYVSKRKKGPAIHYSDVREVWDTLTSGEGVREMTRRRIEELLAQGDVPNVLGLRTALTNALERWKLLQEDGN